MSGMLTWQTEERCVVGKTIFQTLPADLLDREHPNISTEGADFLLFKEPPLIERYAELLGELRPRHIVELGVMEGGGTAFLFEVAQPRRLVAIDRRPPMNPALRNYVAGRGLEEAVRVYDDVDQADRPRLAQIVDEEFGEEPLDLVVDDCSHIYEATRASFSELFPRLRPGGIFAIEDWAWAHEAPLDRLWAEHTPLTRLVFELVLGIPFAPDLISEIVIEHRSVLVRRGDGRADPRGFDIADCSNARGRELLK